MTFVIREPATAPVWLPEYTRSISDALDTLDRRDSVDLTASGSIKVSHAVTLVDATAGPVTVTLPAVRDAMGQTFSIKKVDATGNAVTISGDATIDGAASLATTTQWECFTIHSTGDAWFIL